jgi:hypothetical protein
MVIMITREVKKGGGIRRGSDGSDGLGVYKSAEFAAKRDEFNI